MSEPKVENVKDFFDKLAEIQKHKEDDTELFFRGHADQSYEAEPAIFRKNEKGERKLLQNEKHLFNDIITQCPEDFKNCQNTFEYLVKMQHYGLPTRLLDITSNALVALYFACCSLNSEYDRKDGQVLVYEVQKDAIKNYNSDTVSVLSNLAQLDSDFEVESFYTLVNNTRKDLNKLISFYKKIEELFDIHMDEAFNKTFKEDLERMISDSDRIEKTDDEIKKQYTKTTLKYIEQNYRAIIEKIRKIDKDKQVEKDKLMNEALRISILIDNQCGYLRFLQRKKERLLHFIKQEKSYFVDKIDDFSVKKIVCVRAKLDNSRIIRQNGLFFLFGMGDTKGDPIILSEYIKGFLWSANGRIQEIITPKILISGKAKKDILKELSALGISEETLMPEIDTVARTIKNRYN